jgi:hypothetical protein
MSKTWRMVAQRIVAGGEFFLMKSLRSKIVLLLIIYFAGFATAIYYLAPVPDNQACLTDSSKFVHSAFKSDEFAKDFNSGLHKAIDLAKDAACRAGTFLKQKYHERQNDG